jgi:hypothetical protein
MTASSCPDLPHFGIFMGFPARDEGKNENAATRQNMPDRGKSGR